MQQPIPAASSYGDEIDLFDIVRFFLRWKLLIIGGLLLGTTVAVIIFLTRTNQTVVTTTLVVPQGVTALRSLVYQPTVMESVVKDLDLVKSYGLDPSNPDATNIAMANIGSSLTIEVGLIGEKKVQEDEQTVQERTMTLSLRDTDRARAELVLEHIAKRVEEVFQRFQRSLGLIEVRLIFEKNPDFPLIQKYLASPSTLRRVVTHLSLKEAFKLESEESAVDLLTNRLTVAVNPDEPSEFFLAVKDVDFTKATAIARAVVAELDNFDIKDFQEKSSVLMTARASFFPHSAIPLVADFIESSRLWFTVVEKHNLVKAYRAKTPEQARLMARSRLRTSLKERKLAGTQPGLDPSFAFLELVFSDTSADRALACLETIVQEIQRWVQTLPDAASSSTAKQSISEAVLANTEGLGEALRYLQQASTLRALVRKNKLFQHYQRHFALADEDAAVAQLRASLKIDTATLQGLGTGVRLSVADPDPTVAQGLVRSILHTLRELTPQEFQRSVSRPFSTIIEFPATTLTPQLMARVLSPQHINTILEQAGWDLTAARRKWVIDSIAFEPWKPAAAQQKWVADPIAFEPWKIAENDLSTRPNASITKEQETPGVDRMLVHAESAEDNQKLAAAVLNVLRQMVAFNNPKTNVTFEVEYQPVYDLFDSHVLSDGFLLAMIHERNLQDAYLGSAGTRDLSSLLGEIRSGITTERPASDRFQVNVRVQDAQMSLTIANHIWKSLGNWNAQPNQPLDANARISYAGHPLQAFFAETLKQPDFWKPIAATNDLPQRLKLTNPDTAARWLAQRSRLEADDSATTIPAVTPDQVAAASSSGSGGGSGGGLLFGNYGALKGAGVLILNVTTSSPALSLELAQAAGDRLVEISKGRRANDLMEYMGLSRRPLSPLGSAFLASGNPQDRFEAHTHRAPEIRQGTQLPVLAIRSGQSGKTLPLEMRLLQEPTYVTPPTGLRMLDTPAILYRIPDHVSVRLVRGPFFKEAINDTGVYRTLQPVHYDITRTNKANSGLYVKMVGAIFIGLLMGLFGAALLQMMTLYRERFKTVSLSGSHSHTEGEVSVFQRPGATAETPPRLKHDKQPASLT